MATQNKTKDNRHYAVIDTVRGSNELHGYETIKVILAGTDNVKNQQNYAIVNALEVGETALFFGDIKIERLV